MTKTPYERARELADHWKPMASVVPEPQDYLDLSAASCLLMALGHLTAAMRKLHEEPASRATYKALVYATEAGNFARFALALLDEQKEETCEKS